MTVNVLQLLLSVEVLRLPLWTLSSGSVSAIDCAVCPVLRFNTRPPFLTNQLSSVVVAIVPWTVVFHLLMGIWVFGNSQVLDSGVLDLSQV